MRERVQIALLGAAFIWVVGTSAWTINEVGKNNRAILNLSMRTQEQEEARKVEIARAFDVLNRKIDRLLPATVGHEHSDVRRFMIAGHLARTVRPVVVFGDSITEGAILPNTICGHAVVNAGIGGAGVDELVNDAPSLLADKSAALVVIAIGTNDAHVAPDREEKFSASYAELLQSLSRIASKIAVASIPAVDPRGELAVAVQIDPSLIDRFNLVLPKLAADAGATFIDVHNAVSAGPPATIDGVHLTPGAYDRWDGAMLTGIKKALNCAAIANAP